MKRTLILLMTLALLAGTAAIPAFAEETGNTPDQITSATEQPGKEIPGNQQQTPDGSQQPQTPGSTQTVRTPMRRGRNNPQPGTPGEDGRGAKQGKGIGGRNNGTPGTRNGGKQVDPDRLLAEGVITREVYDAIVNRQSSKAQQQAVPAAPAGNAEAPAASETEQESRELRLLKELLGSGAITQEQYDLLAAPYAAAESAGVV